MKNQKNENSEIIETSAAVLEEEKKENSFKKALKSVGCFFKKFKSGKIKNDALLKRGGYSLAITAVVLACLIILNWWLMPALANRFHLEFDMTTDKKNSISEENIEYIKGIEGEVNITVCATKDDYANYMSYYAPNYYGVEINSASDLEYFEQTITLISKYAEYNDNLKIKYVDPQSTEFTAITTSYSAYALAYGDILVTSTVSGNERVKHLTFNDIYSTSESSSSSYSYYSSYTLNSNRIESALTSAISYVTSADTKKVAVLSGHSENAYTSAYQELLTANNYDITEISDQLITSISSDYDAVIIAAPTVDFIGSELDVISEFLDNGGKLGKGLIFFADASCPAMPNLYDFLAQWGISVGEGLLFETNSSNHITGKPSSIGIYPAEVEDDDITATLTYAIADFNVPMNVCEPASTTRKATALMQTLDSAVIAPVGASSDWSDYTEDDTKQFDSVIQSVESDYDSDNNLLTSYVMAFSSVEYVQSTWASYSELCNQDIVMACTDRASHVGDTSMTFTSKVIENESFASSVTAGSSKAVNIIFMFVLPIAVIAVGIVIYVRRRNAR